MIFYATQKLKSNWIYVLTEIFEFYYHTPITVKHINKFNILVIMQFFKEWKITTTLASKYKIKHCVTEVQQAGFAYIHRSDLNECSVQFCHYLWNTTKRASCVDVLYNFCSTYSSTL